MKFALIAFITLTNYAHLCAQDGSDILYTAPDRLDDSYLGDFIHLDFYNRSFRGAPLDTITIMVDGRPVAFLEYREDNGFNNWFHRQYLAADNNSDGQTIRIVQSRLDGITANTIIVTNFVEYYRNGQVIPQQSKQLVAEFPKTIIADVLVSADSHLKKQQ